jgi:hypothetical protein
VPRTSARRIIDANAGNDESGLSVAAEGIRRDSRNDDLSNRSIDPPSSGEVCRQQIVRLVHTRVAALRQVAVIAFAAAAAGGGAWRSRGAVARILWR